MLFQSHAICPICLTPGQHWCTTQDWEYRSTTDFYTYLQCPNCLTLFIKEVPHDSLLTIYPPNYYSFSGTAGNSVFKLKDLWDRRFFSSLLKDVTGPALSVLDVGGGTGNVLDTLKTADERIIYTEIIDIDTNARTQAEKKGHVYIQSTIEAYTPTRKFDVILLLNIIEHISNPADMIAKCGELLQTNGIIIIKTPNADSMDAKLFKNYYWGGLHCPRHWIIFSDQSFKYMLSSLNLQLHKITFTQGAPFWAYGLLQLFRKKDITLKKLPLVNHPLFAPVSLLFALFDVCRSWFAKTSQMFIVLKR